MDATIEIHRPQRCFPAPPEPRVLVLPAPPAPPPITGSRTELVTTGVAAASAAGFALVAGTHAALVLAAVVLLGGVGGSIALRLSARRRGQREWSAERDRYQRAVGLITAEARAAADAQRATLERAHPAPGRLLAAVGAASALWERRASHADFGAVRLGLGQVPARVTVAAAGAAPPASADPGLARLHATAVRSHDQLEGAPVTARLTDLERIAVVGDRDAARRLLSSWTAQLAAWHAPDELRIVPVGALAGQAAWRWLTWLPHVVLPSPGGQPHTVQLVDATVPGEPEGPEGPGGRAARVDPPRGSRSPGVTTIVLCADEQAVPEQVSAIVELDVDGTATFHRSGAEGRMTEFVPEPWDDAADAPALARWLAPRRVRETVGAGGTDPVRLTDLLDADGPALLRTPVGRTADGRPLVLDLRESSRGGVGPHGILIGATGSGKSELLRSLVLGLTSTAPPQTFATLLVDFKGGAAFADLAALPHAVGLVTNLEDDPGQVDRVQEALAGEILRRQRLLRDAGGLASVWEYQAHPSAQGTPMPHLLVVVDEFGELLEARPDFLATFTTIGRLGRSLGLYLLLASQRLDEGRLRGLESHLSYRIALRTFTAAESCAVLGSAAAAELPPQPGVGYLATAGQVVRFRGATTGLPRADAARRATGGPLVTELGPGWTGPPEPGGDADARPSPSPGPRDLDVLLEAAAARGAGSRAAPIWLPPLPERLSCSALPVARRGAVAIGLLDDPAAQAQPPLVLRLDGGSNHVALVGAPRSGRSTFLRTHVQTLVAIEPPERLQVYLLDLGGSLAPLAHLPHAGAVAARSDGPALRRILAELATTLDDRARVLRAAGCATLAALDDRSDAEQWLPDPHRARLLLVVDDVGQLRTDHPEAEQQLAELAVAGPALGLHLALTAHRWTEIRQPILDTVGTRLELWLSDPADSRHGRTRSAGLPRVPGRGLGPEGHELQLAEPAERPIVATSRHRAVGIAPLPHWVAEDERPADQLPGAFRLGLQEHRLACVDLDLLAEGFHLLVFGDSGSGRSTLLRRVVRQLGARPGAVVLHLVDPARALAEVAESPAVAGYAYDRSSAAGLADRLDADLTARRPPPGLSPSQLATRSWWQGPEHVLVVDDHDLLVGAQGSPLAGLGDHVRAGRDRGFHVVLSRRVTGAARGAFEPFLSAVRESSPIGLVLSGDRAEGPLVADVAAQRQPPGRGVLVRPGRRPALVQLAAPARR